MSLAKTPVFSRFGREEVSIIRAGADVTSHPVGTVILRRGDTGQSLRILTRGRVRVLDDRDPANPITLAVLRPGAIFGERSLLFGAPANATVRAASSVTVEAISAAAFQKLLSSRPEIADVMREAIAAYDRANSIRSSPAFASLDLSEIDLLVATAQEVHLGDAEPLFPSGVSADGVWLVTRGNLSATALPDPSDTEDGETAQPEPRRTGMRRVGDLIGLRRHFDPAARPQELTAVGDATVLHWPSSLLREIAERDRRFDAGLRDAARLAALRIETLLGGASLQEERVVPGGSAPLDRLCRRRLRIGSGLSGRSVTAWWSPDPRIQGLACIATVASWFGQDPDLSPAIESRLSGHRDEGLAGLSRRAEAAGLMTRMLNVPAERISPAMAPFVWASPDGHIRVVLSIDGRRALVVDPATGEAQQRDTDTLRAAWTGRVLSISFVPDFGDIGAKATTIARRLAPLLRPHRRTAFRLGLLTLLGLVVGVMTPLASATIIDHVLVFDDHSLLWLLLVAILFAGLMSLLAGAARSLLTLYAANQINEVLSSRLFAHVLAVPLGQLTKWRTGDLAMRFDENQKIFRLALEIVEVLLFDILSVLVFGGALFLIAPALGALVLIFTCLVGTLLVWASPRLRANDQAVFEARGKVQSHVIEMFGGIETIKFAVREPVTTSTGMDLFRDAKSAQLAGARLAFRVHLAVSFIGAIAGVCVLGLGGMQVLEGTMSTGELVAVSGLLGGIMGPLASIAGVYDRVQELRIAIGRVNDVLGLPREQSTGSAPCPPLVGAIRLRQVSFSYMPGEGRKTLDSLDLEIPAGSKVAFVGPSGSGKSTILRLFNRLLDPDEGQITIDGIDISQVEPDSLRRQIGVVEQAPHIFSGTIRENIAKTAPDLPFERIATAARLSGAADFIERMPLGYATRVGEGGRALSGGQAQRIAIARAIAADPALLLLDEATSALDSEAEAAVQRGLDAAMTGRTVIAVAHRLSTIRNADIIVVMKDGRIVEQGDHETLLALGGAYKALVIAGGETGGETRGLTGEAGGQSHGKPRAGAA